MRTVDSHLLEEKIDEAVTHYINVHPTNETVHVDGDSITLNVQEDASGRIHTVMHPQTFSTQMCRLSMWSPGAEGAWGDELVDPGRLASLVAHLAQQARAPPPRPAPPPPPPHPLPHTLRQPSPAVSQAAQAQGLQAARADAVLLDARLFSTQTLEPVELALPPLAAAWKDHKDEAEAAAASPANKHSKKSLPHKKRISRKLKRGAAGAAGGGMAGGAGGGEHAPHALCEELVVLAEQSAHEEILPDSFADAPHEVRAVLICQTCGAYFGEEQLRFYQHLRQHYEPPDHLAMDKMMVEQATLPDSIVELSLESTLPRSSVYGGGGGGGGGGGAGAELYGCARCDKTFRKQKHCEAHIREAHSKPEEPAEEFSEPEDLMEGIHVAVDSPASPHDARWYSPRASGSGACPAGAAYCPVCPAAPPAPPPAPAPAPAAPAAPRDHDHADNIKEEVFQRMFEVEIELPPPSPEPGPARAGGAGGAGGADPRPEPAAGGAGGAAKPPKVFECVQCGHRVHHRNSLVYHMLSHRGARAHACPAPACGKTFYTKSALKIHQRVHNGDKPYKCPECGRDFRQWGDLRNHLRSLHSDKKHHQCDFCGKEFARKYSLSLHRRIHTGEKNYPCSECGKTFRASSYRLTHMRTHTGYKPHACPHCDKSFRVAADMRRHVRLTHDAGRQHRARAPAAPRAPAPRAAAPRAPAPRAAAPRRRRARRDAPGEAAGDAPPPDAEPPAERRYKTEPEELPTYTKLKDYDPAPPAAPAPPAGPAAPAPPGPLTPAAGGEAAAAELDGDLNFFARLSAMYNIPPV